ncbi:MAG: hypothetical protein ABJN26_23215 [Stappiaceae bacterium]
MLTLKCAFEILRHCAPNVGKQRFKELPDGYASRIIDKHVNRSTIIIDLLAAWVDAVY